MKSMSKIFVILITLFIFNMNTLAEECSNADIVNLGKEAVSVKVSYEEKEGKTKPGESYPPDGYQGDPKEYVMTYYYFNINFFNISPNLYIELSNDANDEEITVKYEDTNNGNYQIKWTNLTKPVTFNYKIIASQKSNCFLKEIKKGTLLIPMYNPYYKYNECNGIEDYYLCQKYISKYTTYKDFLKQVKKYKSRQYIKKKKEEEKQNEKSFLNNLKTIYNNNKTLSIIIIISLLVLILLFVFIRKIRKRNI